MSINYWRLIEQDYDGHALSQCLKCYEKIHAPYESISTFKYCPYCGIEWCGELECRKHDELKYEYIHPEIDWDEYNDKIKYNNTGHIRFWIQSRNKSDRKPEWYSETYCFSLESVKETLERTKFYDGYDKNIEYRVVNNKDYIIK